MDGLAGASMWQSGYSSRSSRSSTPSMLIHLATGKHPKLKQVFYIISVAMGKHCIVGHGKGRGMGETPGRGG